MKKILKIAFLLCLLSEFFILRASTYESNVIEYDDISFDYITGEKGTSKTIYFFAKIGDELTFDYSAYYYDNMYGSASYKIQIDGHTIINDEKIYTNGSGTSGFSSHNGSYTYRFEEEGEHVFYCYFKAENANNRGSYCKINNLKLTQFYQPVTNSPYREQIVGEGNIESRTPFSYLGYNYGVMQSIYTPEEIGGGGIISKISYHRANSEMDDRGLTIYMGHKIGNFFSSVSDYLPYDDMTLVYSGPVNKGDSDWDLIKLDKEFLYDGVNGLVVVICYNDDFYDDNLFYYHSNVLNSTLYRYTTGHTVGSEQYADPSKSYNYTMSNYRPNIKFTINYGIKIGTHYTGTGLTYALYEDKTARLIDGIGYIGKELVIPEVIEDNGVRYIVTTICKNALANNKTITSVEVAPTITCIESRAFYGCVNLLDFSLKDGDSVIEIDKTALANSPLDYVYIGRNMVGACFSNQRELTNVRYGSNVAYVSICAFENCESISKVKMPSIEYIGASAFLGCNSLKEVSLGVNIENLGTYSFASCPSLENFYMQREVPISIRDNVFSSSNVTNAILHVPSGTRTSYEEADVWKDFGTIVDIDPVKMIYSSLDGNVVSPDDEEAFDGDIIYNIYKNGEGIILFRGELTTIGRSAFAECTSLVSATIPESVTKIDRYGFQDCEALESVVLPAGLETIDKYAFLGCENLEEVSIYALVPPALYSSSFEVYGTLHVMKGYKEVYEADDIWKNFTIVDDLTIDEGAIFADGSIYKERRPQEIEELIYTRSFLSADNWQALYVPFCIPVETLTENGFEVAELNNIHMYDTDNDKKFDKTTLEFLYLIDGETKANYPYLIKSSIIGEVKLYLDDVALEPAKETQIECASTRKVFKIKGTYTGVSGADMFNNNYYAVGGGTLVKAASADNALKPQRWYMSIENKDGSPVDYFAPKMRIMINGMEIDEEETGIQDIAAPTVEDVVYTLDGRKMNASALPSGIYVKNHKKMIVQ